LASKRNVRALTGSRWLDGKSVDASTESRFAWPLLTAVSFEESSKAGGQKVAVSQAEVLAQAGFRSVAAILGRGSGASRHLLLVEHPRSSKGEQRSSWRRGSPSLEWWKTTFSKLLPYAPEFKSWNEGGAWEETSECRADALRTVVASMGSKLDVGVLYDGVGVVGGDSAGSWLKWASLGQASGVEEMKVYQINRQNQ
jgi:hypothetical protein